ncbi:MAG: glycogen debranching protein GlgX [Bacteroidetes bacterium]|nr:glycogen debranching protein GlgX [Bacteroidota bacterium]
MKSRKRKTDPLKYIGSDFEISRGHPLPLGASIQRGGINFSVYSKHATQVTLVVINPETQEIQYEFPFNEEYNRTGDIWHLFVKDLDVNIGYGFRMERKHNRYPHIHRFNEEFVLQDPYARALAGGHVWNTHHKKSRFSVISNDEYDWKTDRPLNIPLRDTIIYELHVRGFTAHPSSKVKDKGTFSGLKEKIPYLKDLGITAVELLPVTEFEENDDFERYDPVNGSRLVNFWGYSPISFFAPKAAYAATGASRGQVREFKDMVKAFHAAGIEVFLDVVFNHTAEGNELGPTFNFRGLDNATYYIIDPVTGKYHNYSGCGNTMNCNHPFVRDFILDCLRYWVTEMKVDGFRFDLASILGRDTDGTVLNNPPLLERIAADPVLSKTKIIAEAWDAAGLYQVGSFPHWHRWAEWNGKFRDDIRRFVKGDPGLAGEIAARLTGSADLYEKSGRAPYDSINFITSHDGFTMADLVSYNRKYNEPNGENNQDGSNDNHSWNCGEEGPTEDQPIRELRFRQIKNLATLLMASNGVPMLLAGDEFGRTQQGNNNAYCHDNEISWVNWRLKSENSGLFRFFKLLIAFRKANPILRRERFDEYDIIWHGFNLYEPDWSEDARWISVHFSGARYPELEGCKHIQLIANAHWEPHTFALPKLVGKTWYVKVNTANESPADICSDGKETAAENQERIEVAPRSVLILTGL